MFFVVIQSAVESFSIFIIAEKRIKKTDALGWPSDELNATGLEKNGVSLNKTLVSYGKDYIKKLISILLPTMRTTCLSCIEQTSLRQTLGLFLTATSLCIRES